MKLDLPGFSGPCSSLKEGLEDRFRVALESLLASSELSTLRLGFLICSIWAAFEVFPSGHYE